MPWPRNDPDPLAARRRQLAEQERLLLQQRTRLEDELHHSGEPPTEEAKPAHVPVWRQEDDAVLRRPVAPSPARKRHLGRQRQRDMMLFFICILVLLLVVLLVVWVALVHNSAPNNGA